MNLDLMMVLSMRQKEMSYQQSARLTPTPPSFFAPPAHQQLPQQQSQYGTLGGGSSTMTAFGMLPSIAAPLSPATPGFSSHFSTKHGGGAVARGSFSPLSVGQLPYSNNYDQFGYTWHWIAGVCAHFALQRQTAHFAIQYAHIILRKRALLREHDAYSIRNYDDVFAVQRELQLLGLTCVFMAAKIEEVHPPKATELATFISEQGAVNCGGDDLVRYEGEYLVVSVDVMVLLSVIGGDDILGTLSNVFMIYYFTTVGTQLEPPPNDPTLLVALLAGGRLVGATSRHHGVRSHG